MPNYSINHENTAACDSAQEAAQAMEAILERFPNTMTVHFSDVTFVPSGYIGWALYDGQYMRLIQDAYHVLENDPIDLQEV